MSYRPENQSIEDPAREIIAGIESFENAVQERIKSGEWGTIHIDKLTAFAGELNNMKYRLMQLAENTW
jgi:hypothetical protein